GPAGLVRPGGLDARRSGAAAAGVGSDRPETPCAGPAATARAVSASRRRPFRGDAGRRDDPRGGAARLGGGDGQGRNVVRAGWWRGGGRIGPGDGRRAGGRSVEGDGPEQTEDNCGGLGRPLYGLPRRRSTGATGVEGQGHGDPTAADLGRARPGV